MTYIPPLFVRSAIFSIALCLKVSAAESDRSAQTAADAMTESGLLGHIQTLASDAFEGRAPGTVGEQKTVDYLTAQFKRFGLEPGNPDGTYIQNVPMAGIQADPVIEYIVGGKSMSLAFPGESVIKSRRYLPHVTVTNSDLVFVGYGIVAPEYQWDDYKDVDVRGKTIVMLINDPPVPDPKDPSKLDQSTFKGKAMTYYGRWTYKYEIASEKGAAAAIIVHETGPAGYPYYVLIASDGRENFDLQYPDKNMGRVAVEGWITLDKARQLFKAAGQDYDVLKKAAEKRDFRPVTLNAKANFRIKNTLREVASANVVAKLDGGDRKDEWVVYTAHWDHLGHNPKLEGDTIFNGALDNASGTAGLLELAEAFGRIKGKLKRSVLFVATTGEEKGLLGAKYYAEHPLYPLEKTLANINMDGVNPWGRTRDIEVIGYGNSSLEDLLSADATVQGRVIQPDSEPEKGRFFRSDHFEFAKKGVPALYLKAGIDFPTKPPGYGKLKLEEYTAKDYHKPSDEVKPDWDLSGGVEDLRLLFQVGYSVLQGDRFPEWKAGSEFKTRREKMLQGH